MTYNLLTIALGSEYLPSCFKKTIRFQWRPIRKQLFKIWIDFYSQKKKKIYKIDSSLMKEEILVVCIWGFNRELAFTFPFMCTTWQILYFAENTIKHPCDRVCRANETPLVCKYTFDIELHNTLNKVRKLEHLLLLKVR